MGWLSESCDVYSEHRTRVTGILRILGDAADASSVSSMVNYAILTMDPPHLAPDTLQTHGEHGKQLSFILQMCFISQRRGISEDLSLKIIKASQEDDNKCGRDPIYLLTYHGADVSILGPE